MVITSDIMLKGAEWHTADEKLSTIFSKWPHYMIYYLSLSIGILYDKRIAEFEDDGYVMSVPRNVLQNNASTTLDYFFQTAILTTCTETLTEKDRLSLAFADTPSVEFNKIAFLTEFANFGVTILVGLIGESELESMENIKNFLASTMEGTNFEIFDITDEIFEEDLIN